jgi:hypothetical protein
MNEKFELNSNLTDQTKYAQTDKSSNILIISINP